MKSGGKKVRTGCRTCKIRRVKCDEEKPCCYRCFSTGRKCDGYEFESRVVAATKLVHNISVELPGTRKERRAFEFFRSCTAVSICNYFPEDFWDRHFLQASVSQSCLRHAAIAIGALHETLAQDVTANGSCDSHDNLFALRQYSKAITHLSGSLSKNRQYSIVALMCCILFVTFDSLLDHPELAIKHLRSGLEILRSHESTEVDHFHDIFTRMSIIYMESEPKARPLDVWELPKSHCYDPPARFSTTFAAQNCLNSIHEDMFRDFNRRADADFTSAWVSRLGRENSYFPTLQSVEGPQHMPALSMADLQTKYITALRHWSRAFETHLRDTNLDTSRRDLRGALLLKIHQCMALIILSTDLSPCQQPYDVFAMGFKTIIDLCDALVKTEVQSQRMLCVPALGIIGPLYYTAMNCPAEHLHHRAMDLLAIPRREGTRDSRAAVALVARLRCSSSVDSCSRTGSEDRDAAMTSREKSPLMEEDWDTAIWDVFPALATIRPSRPYGPPSHQTQTQMSKSTPDLLRADK